MVDINLKGSLHVINAVAPGNTSTPINEDIRTDPSMKPMLDAMASRTPSGNVFTDPDEIAGLVSIFLRRTPVRCMGPQC